MFFFYTKYRRRSDSTRSPICWPPGSCGCGTASPVLYLLTAEKVRSTVPATRAVMPMPSRLMEARIDRLGSDARGGPEGAAHTGPQAAMARAVRYRTAAL